MDDNIHIRLVLTTIATMFFFILTNLPQSQSQGGENKYTNCSKPYNCGNVSNIFYPFWGHHRPQYCGGGDQLDFKLQCQNDHTIILNGLQNFQVLHIDTTAYTVRMKQTVDDVCSPTFNDIYLDLDATVFTYPATVYNITIFYNCPSSVFTHENNFTCGNENGTYHVGEKDDVLKEHPEFQNCTRHIQVPIQVPLNLDGDRFDALEGALDGGFEVNYTKAHAQECIRCLDSEGACGVNLTSHRFTCYCQDGSDAIHCYGRGSNSTRWNLTWKLLIVSKLQGIKTPPNHQSSRMAPYFGKDFLSTQSFSKENGIIGGVITVLLICIATFCFRCKSSSWHGKFWLTTKDVKKMTNSFKNKLGQGGFGAVYKGQLFNGCPVAVKILRSSKGNNEDFINEVASISSTSHVNVVTLLGFCFEGRKKALIYEFMSNGSLEKFIYRNGHEAVASLNWEDLYQIAMGIARGLEYLHRGCNTRILHFDIKPHNILLDENFCPKISDFGLAKLCPRKESMISMSDARGTIGYVAPEMWNRHFGGVSHKSDVYSYGMMLLEMVGGRRNVNADASHTSELYFPHWVYNRLKQGTDLRPYEVIKTEENEIAKRLTIVGLWCTQTFPNDRPTISRVIDMLEGSMNSLEIPPKPFLSSPTRSVSESSTF
ncbi:LEAF RUST 10 DISEASE-RESISTANCE LOCUS RECEPTOR-LIKE PROTEIN KINASE-like 2.5 isoform X2 [Gastrolobium bilobum]|uniref:LEAF RUST 10 DISEASE-RESISTANCE LOCUS RECEPTOR-LIKE PROTEIN KINASE-like 2.5 isoform X2 n=1 Tax=Gastrolobium bilobum TaxID=150636 RepID=UPI002AAF84F2|nr:LEAF RUST 10 DISEASE-RESISTANCE LOCUS RECEPTOR-LIKE PROTEIN KINASE-like 2.5 isoform X2 [Gastrolobium bilobum]